MLSHIPVSSTSDAVKSWIPKALFGEPLAARRVSIVILVLSRAFCSAELLHHNSLISLATPAEIELARDRNGLRYPTAP
jgi:hypothetical protein